jgi:hypothetical protein
MARVNRFAAAAHCPAVSKRSASSASMLMGRLRVGRGGESDGLDEAARLRAVGGVAGDLGCFGIRCLLCAHCSSLSATANEARVAAA